MANVPLTLKVDPDDKEWFQRFCEAQNVTQSEGFSALRKLSDQPSKEPDIVDNANPNLERLLVAIESRLSALDSPISDKKKIELEREYLSLLSSVAGTSRQAEVIIDGIKTSLDNLRSFNRELSQPIEETKTAYAEMGQNLGESLDKFRAKVDAFVDTSIQRYEDSIERHLAELKNLKTRPSTVPVFGRISDRYLWLTVAAFVSLSMGYIAFQVLPQNLELLEFRSDALREIREVQQMVCVDTRNFGAESLQRLREKVSCR